MADPLDDYRRKRDFAATPEPAPGPIGDRPGNAFVVHRHEARNLHYDLRLEHAGALCSWAVPKGFSYDPADKRLAVRTEDHPLEYEHFHGRIPKGQYGAGTMTIWDRGTYELVKVPDFDASLQRGELKLILRGQRLRGEWHLVKTQQGPNTWLLFKSKDRYAGAARDSALGIDLGALEAGALVVPAAAMSPAASAAPFHDPGWLFEMEFAGRRAFAQKSGDEVHLHDMTQRGIAPPANVARALRQLRCEQALIDGVVTAVDAHGRPCRQALEQALGSGDAGAITFYAFDLLHWEDYDLRALPLLDRKAALRTLIRDDGGVLYVDHVLGNGPALLDAIGAAGLPGAIAKRSSSPYRSGPHEDWRRVRAGTAAAAEPTLTTAPLRRTPVRATNVAKVFWPADGFTKGDLLAYYQQVAEALLPHLQDRPVHFNRFPNGIDGKSFYQREAKEGTPAWVRTVSIGHDGEDVLHHVIDDAATLLYVANLGSIDLHPWLSRVGSLDQPDYAVLDLDPKDAPFNDVVRIARAAGKLLRGIGLRPVLKTSGKNGLHVFVPLRPGYSYDHSRMFIEAVARILARELPDIATVERLPDKRDGKVYLDFLQNRRSQTIVPPYAVRPVRGASVSTPLAWDELEDDDLSPRNFTIITMPERLAARGDLFRAALDDPQDLTPAIAALEDVLRGK